MPVVYPAQYWRATKEWSAWLGQLGTVISVTTIWAAPQELEPVASYQLALVQLPQEKRLMVVEAGREVQEGDQVQVVLRRIVKPEQHAFIPYHLVARLHQEISPL